MDWILTEVNEANKELGKTSFSSLPAVMSREVDLFRHLGAAGFTPEISNHRVQATPGGALGKFVAAWPGAPDLVRYTKAQ